MKSLTKSRKSPLSQPSAKAVKKKEAKAPAKRRATGGFKPLKEEAEITKHERDHLDPKELQAFFKVLPETSYWYPYFFIQYFFACRLSEPALILDTDINVKRNEIHVKRLKKPNDEDGYSEHVYKLDPRVLACVRVAQRWKEQRKVTDNPFLFASNRKRETEDVGAERLSQLRNLDGWQSVSRFTAHRMFQRIAAEIKLPERLRHSHVLRHTRAVVMLACHADIKTVHEHCSHSSIKMTQRYQAFADDAAEKMKHTEIVKMGLGL